MLWDDVVVPGRTGEVLLSETLKLDVWVAVAHEMGGQKSRWMVCHRSVR